MSTPEPGISHRLHSEVVGYHAERAEAVERQRDELRECLTQQIGRIAELEAQAEELLSALKDIVAADWGTNEDGVPQAVLVRWQRALEIAYRAIDKAEGN